MRVDAAEFTDQSLAGDFSEGPSHLHTGGTSTNDAQGQPVLAFFRVRFFLGRFKGKQQAASNFKRVFQGFQARRVGGPFIMAKVTVGGTSRHHQVVKQQTAAIRQQHLFASGVDVGHLGQQGGQVRLFAKQTARGGGDGWCGQTCRGDLVKQGLEQMVVGLVHQGDVHRRFGQGLGGFEPTKAATDDEDAWSLGCLHQAGIHARRAWCRAICACTCAGAVPPKVLRAFKEPCRLNTS